ncbi:MAG: hypothetical protein JW783_01515 [Bacteroidales bacterium]|nr:hypothetical protein [Bacteroidales bacterium]MBN2749202.1 hypothetical protein [Bacteroidales bacterium]
MESITNKKFALLSEKDMKFLIGAARWEFHGIETNCDQTLAVWKKKTSDGYKFKRKED